VVLPGFIDAHVHILNFGLSLQKLDLFQCKTLGDIRKAIAVHAALHPSDPRILCRGWNQSSTDGIGLAAALDDLDPRPIYIEALDMHSTWCNTPALRELNLGSIIDPPGGRIHRDQAGQPSGLFDEAAQFSIVCPFLNQTLSMDKKLAAIDTAFLAHRRAGYTGLVDMAMDEVNWEALNIYRNQHKNLPFHVAAHWLIPYSQDRSEIERHLDRAIDLHRQFNRTTSPAFCINGVKFICDGTVDGCTAGLLQPYCGLMQLVDPIWPVSTLASVIRRATDAGLQCALHAIGDRTVRDAIDILAQLPNLRQCRHRIEHLELTTQEDAKRLGDLGIVASLQPVHLDPATFDSWPELLGADRCKRAFAYRDFADGGAPLAFGTDAPTAKHLPLPNLYNATTRRSALVPEMKETLNPEFALPLSAAVSAATSGAAFACFADSWTGRLQSGLQADFVVLDMHWNADRLLEAHVCQTWYQGKKVFDVDEGES
jgi:predicted amidohydrolase YtcJ